MVRTLIRVGAVITLIPLLLASCGGGAKRVAGPAVSGPIYGSVSELVAWVNVTRVEFHAGESIQIEVGVRNPTARSIVVGFPTACISYVVRDASGSTVAPNSLCTGIAPPYEMAPGENIAVPFSWDGAHLPPGDYQVGSWGFPPSAAPVSIRILAP